MHSVLRATVTESAWRAWAAMSIEIYGYGKFRCLLARKNVHWPCRHALLRSTGTSSPLSCGKSYNTARLKRRERKFLVVRFQAKGNTMPSECEVVGLPHISSQAWRRHLNYALHFQAFSVHHYCVPWKGSGWISSSSNVWLGKPLWEGLQTWRLCNSIIIFLVARERPHERAWMYYCGCTVDEREVQSLSRPEIQRACYRRCNAWANLSQCIHLLSQSVMHDGSFKFV